jgi:DNA helicase-2/ATP-dependent DNA helicase PcrA
MDKTIAILSRTNLGLRPFEQALTDAKVPYHLIGKSGFWNQPEVKAVLAYLGCVVWPADWLVAGAIRAPFWPAKFLPKTALLAALKKPHSPSDVTIASHWVRLTGHPESLVEAKNLPALREFVQFIHQLSRYKDLAPAEALKSVISALKAVEYYRVEEDHALDNDPVGNLVELVKLAERYGSIKEFLDFTRRASAASKSRKGVGLSTIHSFKGAEADVIYVVGVSEGVLPHAKATDLDEERNIWFTAASRPRHRLIVTYSGQPSPFLRDCGIMTVKEPK